MRILVVGAGALGSYFGGRLLEAGRDVTFLVRSGRAEQIARYGLRIDSLHGNVDLRPRTVQAGNLSGPYNLVFLAVKAYSLDAAIDDFAPAVSPETAILPVINGMRHLDALTARFGPERVLGGLAQIAATLGPEGQVLHRMRPRRSITAHRRPITAHRRPMAARPTGAPTAVGPNTEPSATAGDGRGTCRCRSAASRHSGRTLTAQPHSLLERGRTGAPPP